MYTIHSSGKVTLLTLFSLVGVFVLASLFDIEYRGQVTSVQATSTATTTVTVLNTPPNWVITAREQIASATTTPTNEGTSTIITARADDNNSESYMLVVCSASSTITVNATAPPVCVTGTTYGVSATTTSGSDATVSISTAGLPGVAPNNQVYPWYAYICDRNLGDPECNDVMYNGTHEAGPVSATSSPFVVNHAPTITNVVITDNEQDPGQSVEWTSTATDTDTIRGGDALTLYVCRADNFDATIPGCLTPGWATSSPSLAATQATSTLIAIPTQDDIYDAYVFVVDPFGMEATGALQGSPQPFQVNNVAPTIGGAISTGLYNVFASSSGTTTLVLTEPEGVTQNFVAMFDVTDNNGCLATTSTNEIQSMIFNVARSGSSTPDGTGCDGDDIFNANSCYQDTYTGWVPNCYQAPYDTCLATDNHVRWECTFPLWFIADPTDAGSKYSTEYWMAVMRATDDGFGGDTPLTGVNGTSTTNSEMQQFLSFRATGSPIAYGSFEPGFGSTVHPATTTVYATGNTGLDQFLSSSDMCLLTGCTVAGNTISIGYQHWSLTNTTPFWSGATTTASTSPTSVAININKPQATTTPSNCTLGSASCGNTYWGIFVPGAITFAGDYTGVNYIDAVVSDQTDW